MLILFSFTEIITNILGCSKSLFGFLHNILWKAQMNFLANPVCVLKQHSPYFCLFLKVIEWCCSSHKLPSFQLVQHQHTETHPCRGARGVHWCCTRLSRVPAGSESMSYGWAFGLFQPLVPTTGPLCFLLHVPNDNTEKEREREKPKSSNSKFSL